MTDCSTGRKPSASSRAFASASSVDNSEFTLLRASALFCASKLVGIFLTSSAIRVSVLEPKALLRSSISSATPSGALAQSKTSAPFAAALIPWLIEPRPWPALARANQEGPSNSFGGGMLKAWFPTPLFGRVFNAGPNLLRFCGQRHALLDLSLPHSTLLMHASR